MTEATASVRPKPSAVARLQAAGRDRPRRRAAHQAVDVGVEPHVERPGGPCPDGNRDQCGRADDWIDVPRRDGQPTSAVKTTSDITRGLSSAK